MSQLFFRFQSFFPYWVFLDLFRTKVSILRKTASLQTQHISAWASAELPRIKKKALIYTKARLQLEKGPSNFSQASQEGKGRVHYLNSWRKKAGNTRRLKILRVWGQHPAYLGQRFAPTASEVNSGHCYVSCWCSKSSCFQRLGSLPLVQGACSLQKVSALTSRIDLRRSPTLSFSNIYSAVLLSWSSR